MGRSDGYRAMIGQSTSIVHASDSGGQGQDGGDDPSDGPRGLAMLCQLDVPGHSYGIHRRLYLRHLRLRPRSLILRHHPGRRQIARRESRRRII